MHLVPCSAPPGPMESAPLTPLASQLMAAGAAVRGAGMLAGFWAVSPSADGEEGDADYVVRSQGEDGLVTWYRLVDDPEVAETVTPPARTFVHEPRALVVRVHRTSRVRSGTPVRGRVVLVGRIGRPRS